MISYYEDCEESSIQIKFFIGVSFYKFSVNKKFLHTSKLNSLSLSYHKSPTQKKINYSFEELCKVNSDDNFSLVIVVIITHKKRVLLHTTFILLHR